MIIQTALLKTLTGSRFYQKVPLFLQKAGVTFSSHRELLEAVTNEILSEWW